MAAKLKDGLFIGDAATSQDPEFLELNKICNMINLAGNEIPNIWAAHGLVYLTFNWENSPDYALFDDHDEILHEIVSFIDMSLRHGVSILLFSLQGTCRCAVAACAYLMYKYGWGFEKSYDFLVIKSSEVDINRGFVQQLFQLERRLMISKYKVYDVKQLSPRQHARMHSWEPDSYLSSEESDEEERVLLNSYNNSKTTLRCLPHPSEGHNLAPKAFALTFNLRPQFSSSMHHPAPPNAPQPVSILRTSKRSQHNKNNNGVPPLPSEGRSDSKAGAPSSPDLYDFVGLRPKSGSKGVPASAEERLHKILSSLQEVSSNGRGAQSEAKVATYGNNEEDFLSIHELAKAPVTANFATTQNRSQQSSSSSRRQLRASGGVVLSNSNTRQQAWAEEKPASSSVRSAPPASNKRHSSPAPQLARSGLAARANNSSNVSVGSYNSYRSTASSSKQEQSSTGRGQTPPRQRPSTPTRRSQQVSASLLQPTVASSRANGRERRPQSPSRAWKY